MKLWVGKQMHRETKLLKPQTFKKSLRFFKKMNNKTVKDWSVVLENRKLETKKRIIRVC